MNSCTCYRLLGLEKGASAREIKSAYRKMALKYHPDKSVSKQDDEKFKLINKAYQILRTDHVRCIDENLNPPKPNDQIQNDNSFGSKMPYWNEELNPNKILKKDWRKYTKYAEKAYHDFCKYEDEMWDYSEKMVKRTTLHVPFVVTKHTRIPLLFVSQIYGPLLKKGKYTGVRLKNRLRLLNKNL